MFKAGEDMLVASLEQCPQVTYRRDGTALASVRAEIGSTHAVTQDADGYTVHIRLYDFLLLTADLPANFEPRVGDVIKGHDQCHYLVSAIDNEPCWRAHTRRSRRVIRVHTRHVSDSHPAAAGGKEKP